MGEVQVWDDKTHLFLGEAIYAHFYVYADPATIDADLQHAFHVQATIRVGGMQFWDTGRVRLANGPFVATPDPAIQAVTSLPLVQAEIDDWNALDHRGASGQWKTASILTFLIASKLDVTLPVAEIVAALAKLGAPGVAASAVLGAAAMFGKRVRLTIGHTNISIPLQRDARGKIAQVHHLPLAAAAAPA